MTSPARICFQLQVKPELLAEYVERHSPVWPEMLAEIAASGRRNYSLYLADGGSLIGYYETDDDAVAQAYLAASPVAARWEAEMGAVLRRPRRADPTRPPRSSPRSSTSKTNWGCRRLPRDIHHSTTKATHREHPLPRHPGHPRAAGHRAALVGIRQLRHAVPRVDDRRHPARPVREDRGCRGGQSRHRPRPERRAAHPVGQGRGLRRPAPPRRRPRRRARHDQLEHVPGRGLQVRRAHPRGRPHPPQGDRSPPRVHRRHGRHRLARPEDLARRGLELPRPDRHARPPGPAERLAPRRSTSD